MSSIRTSRRARALSYVLLAALVVPLSPWAVSAAHAQSGRAATLVDPEARNRTVLLFRVADETSEVLPELRVRMRKIATNSLQMAIDEVRGLECTEFSPTSPLVRRAASEGSLLPTQIETGPTDAREAVEIGCALGVDTVVLAGIRSWHMTQHPRRAEIILSGQAYDVKPNYDIEAGEAVEKPIEACAFGVIGASRNIPGYAASERQLAREALSDAAYKAAKVLSGATISEAAKPRPGAKKTHKKSRLMAYLLAIGVVAWIISESGGGGAAGPSADAFPPTPLPLQPEGTSTIRILWEAPTGTAFVLLRYQIQRRVDNGNWSYFGTGGASKNVDKSLTQYPDYGVSTGHSYQYRIRAVYTNSKFSFWVPFAGVTL